MPTPENHFENSQSHLGSEILATEPRSRQQRFARIPPRVVYVGDGQIGYSQSAGYTLSSMYSDYPWSNITQYATKVKGLVPKGTLVPIRRVSESPLALPFRGAVLAILVVRKLLGLKSPAYISTLPGQPLTPWSKMYATLVALVDILPIRFPRRAERLIRRHRPEIVNTLIGDARTVQRALKISKRLGIPVVPFITDDWPSTIFSSGELGGRARDRTLKLLNELLDRSPVLLVTGEAMAREYSLRFAKPCFIASASVDPDDFSSEFVKHSGRRRLVCVGSPHIGRAELADVVARYCRQRDWEVVVYPVGYEAWLSLSSEVSLQRQLVPEAVPPVLCQADALLFVESLDKDIASYTRLSVSGKLSQLIAASRPILGIGPKGQGSIEELRTHAARAIILHNVDDESLLEGFNYLEMNLDTVPNHIPEQFLVETLQGEVVNAFREAIRIWTMKTDVVP